MIMQGVFVEVPAVAFLAGQGGASSFSPWRFLCHGFITMRWQYADIHAEFAAAGAVHQAMSRPCQSSGFRLECSWSCGQMVCLVVCLL